MIAQTVTVRPPIEIDWPTFNPASIVDSRIPTSAWTTVTRFGFFSFRIETLGFVVHNNKSIARDHAQWGAVDEAASAALVISKGHEAT
jgi:hypothetical protein